jgi:hypothetical protein
MNISGSDEDMAEPHVELAKSGRAGRPPIPVKVDRGWRYGSINPSKAHFTAALTRVATPAVRMALSR